MLIYHLLKKFKIKGVKVCRQAKAFWDEEFDKRKKSIRTRILLVNWKICK